MAALNTKKLIASITLISFWSAILAPQAFADTSTVLKATRLEGKPSISIVNSGATLTLPSIGDTILGRTTTDTLTNKTLSIGSNSITGTQGRAASFNGTTGNLESSAVTTTELTFLSGAQSSVRGVSDTATLTNKTISGASNTLTNIPNSATTATSSNTASAIVARDASGNFSAGTITGNLTGNVTGALTGNASTATLATAATALAANPSDCAAGQKATGIDASGNLTCSSVDLSADTAATALPVSKGGTGATTADNARVNLLPSMTGMSGKVLGTDGFTVSWVAGGGSGGGFDLSNYLTYGEAELGTVVGWTTVAVNLDVTSDTAHKFSGDYSFSYTPLGGSGSYASTDMTIPEGLKGRHCLLYMPYKGANGNMKLTAVVGGVSYSRTLAASSTYTAAEVPFACPSSGGTVTAKLEESGGTGALTYFEMYVGRNFQVGSVNNVTSWQTVTAPVIGGTTSNPTKGTVQVDEYRWRRVGDTVELEWIYYQTGAGAAGSGDYYIPLPAGIVPDSTKMNVGGNGNLTSRVGTAQFYWNNGSGYTAVGSVFTSSTRLGIRFIYDGVGALGADWGSSNFHFGASGAMTVGVKASFPVVGWNAETVYRAENGGLDAGDIVATASSTCPTGTIAADGSAVSRVSYPRLFARIGTAHGTGDGSTTFNLPDYRGRFLRGVTTDSSRDPDYASRTAMNTGGNTGGNVGSIQGDQFASHRHYSDKMLDGQPLNSTNGSYNIMAENGSTATDVQTTAAGGNETRPKNANVTYCIRTVEATPAPVIIPSEASGTSTLSSADLTMTDIDGIRTLLISTGASNRTITIPAASAANKGRTIYFKKTDSGAGHVLISGTIDGTSDTVSVNRIKQQYGYGKIVSDGSQWLWEEEITEYGNITPVIEGLTSSGSTSTYGQQTGKYSRRGRVVNFSMYVVWGAASHSGTGGMALADLPYPAASDSHFTAVAIWSDGVNYPAGRTAAQGYLSPGSSKVRLNANGDSVSGAEILVNDGYNNVTGTGTKQIMLSGSYRI
jgi:microcystin-dependent protein